VQAVAVEADLHHAARLSAEVYGDDALGGHEEEPFSIKRCCKQPSNPSDGPDGLTYRAMVLLLYRWMIDFGYNRSSISFTFVMRSFMAHQKLSVNPRRIDSG
jgi:hypothetical protein